MGQDGFTALRVGVEDGVATVVLDHPPMNLFDFTLVPQIGRVGEELARDQDVRVVVVRSANPDFFAAHFDVTVIQQSPAHSPEMEQRRGVWTRMCEVFRTMPKATIALIEGRAGGGGLELALACDMRFAARENAVFNQWEVAIGLLAGGGGMTRLARLMGRSRTMEMVLGCDDVDGAVAELYGLVNRALPAAELELFVDRLARRIASFPPYAVSAAKEAVLRVEKDIGADLLADIDATSPMLEMPGTRQALARFLELGGQTVAGESRLGELLGELSAPR